MKKVFFPLLLLSLLGNITTTTSSSLATTEASTTETTTITTDSLLDTSLIEESLAESSTSESTQVSSSENVTGGSENGQSTGGESSESSVKEKETSKPQLLATPLAADGSEENPYLVGDITTLIATLSKDIPDGSEELYIKLTNDIIYTSTDISYGDNSKLNITKNTVLDGDGHYLLYDNSNGGNTDYAHFITKTPNLTITYKNLNFGNEQYQNNTWFGILKVLSGATGTNFIVENIDYSMTEGSQPFYATADNCVLTIKGENNFTSKTAPSKYGGEFSEGYSTIIFEENSNTTIHLDTPDGEAFFWPKQDGNRLNLVVKKNAVVDATSSKRYPFFGNNDSTFYVEEDGVFKYKKIKSATGNSYTRYTMNLGDSIAMNFDNSSIVEFSSDEATIEMKKATIVANEPDYILFNFPKSTSNFISSGTLALNRPQITTDTNYQLDYISGGNVNSLTSHFPTNHTETITTSYPSNNTQSLIYQQSLTLNGVTGTPIASTLESKIDTNITGFTPTERNITTVDYLLSKKSLHGNGDINSTEVQQAINDAFNSNDSSYLSKTVTLTAENTDTSTLFENLAGGDYYLYARATGEVTAGFPSTTLWVTTASEPLSLAKVIDTNIPVNMIFKSPTTEFGKKENAGEYTFTNNSNIPIAVDLTEVARTAGSDSDVSLTNSLAPTDTYKLLLNLATNYTDETNNPLVWGPLTEGPISEDSKAMLLEPFWETDKNQAEVYLTGNYSGPVSEVKNVTYNFTFTINAQEETENAN